MPTPSPSKSRPHGLNSRKEATAACDKFQEDIVHFCEFLDDKTELGANDINKVECVMIPHLISMRRYFEEMNLMPCPPVRLPL